MNAPDSRSHRPSRSAAASDATTAVDAALVASRALVAVSARSLAAIGDLTLPQFRALVVLASRGPLPSSELAHVLDVHASTVTRMVDRLVGKGYAVRGAAEDRREVVVSVTPAATDVVAAVTEARRREFGSVIARMPAAARATLTDAFREFGVAAGEVPDSEWSVVLAPPEPA